MTTKTPIPDGAALDAMPLAPTEAPVAAPDPSSSSEPAIAPPPPTPRNDKPLGLDAISRVDRFRIAAHATIDPVTVGNYLKGKRIQPGSAARIEASAACLGIELPKRHWQGDRYGVGYVKSGPLAPGGGDGGTPPGEQ